MALTTEQQANVDMQTMIENVRHVNSLDLENKRVKLEMVRLAKDVLLENARSKPVDSRNVSEADILSFARSMMNFINE